MRRLAILLFATVIAHTSVADDRLIPVITGTIGDRTYRTTVDLRSSSAEDCRFELRAPDGAVFHSVERLEPGEPKLLDEFAADLHVFASAVRVSCTGSVEVHSRIHESANGGATYADGRLFRAIDFRPLSAGQIYATEITGDFVVAEVGGAPVQVNATLTATSSNRVANHQYDLPPFGERSVSTASARTLGPIDGRFVVTGEGSVVVIPETIEPMMAHRASRAPAEIRARLDVPPAAAASPANAAPSITNRLLTSPFKAAPFREPATRLVLMRDRWYDGATGTFLTPDPEGYADSPNPYVYCAGDPVNCSDPTGRHSFVKRKVNGLEFELLAPDPDEVRRGELGMSGSFTHPFTGKRESFSWDQHEAELLLMQARWGNPLLRDAFEQFYGMPNEQVDVSGLRLYWNSLWHHKLDIALSAGFTVSMLAPRPPPPVVRTTPQVNLLRGGVTPQVGATSTLVEGGGLATHERAGGHLLARHVNQTPAQLRARLLAEPRVPAVSTFIDRSVAEAAVDTTLQANQAQISAWMRSASTRPLVLNQAIGRPIGLTLARGAVTPATASNVRIVLMRDATMPMGYRVHTGFPTP
jgi:RHS repeat-associated protein